MTVGEQRSWQVIKACAVVGLLLLFVVTPALSYFSPDAWTAFELAKTLDGDFMRANTAREYSTNNPYSSAFPPLWTVLIAPFVLPFDNIYGSYVAAFLCHVAFVVTSEMLGRRAFGQRGIGLLSALLIAALPAFTLELGQGRDRPLYMLEIAVLGILFLGVAKASPARHFALGLVAGLMVMTRFDALPAALMALLAVPLLGGRIRGTLLAGAGFALAISPWVAYSYTHFGVPFATDNRWVALAAERAYVYDFHVTPPLSLLEDPRGWIGKVLGNIGPTLETLGQVIVESVFVLPLLALVVVKAALQRASNGGGIAEAPVAWKPLGMLALVALAPFAGYLMTGYHDRRYFSVVVWLAELYSLAYLVRGGMPAFGVALVALALGSVISPAVAAARGSRTPLSQVRRQLDRSPTDTLASCLRRAGATPGDPVFFHLSRTRHPWPWTFGAHTGWRVLPQPSNWRWLGADERQAFVNKYRVAFVFGTPQTEGDADLPGLTPVPCSLPLQRTRS